MTSKTVNHVLIDFCQRSPEVEHFRARHHSVTKLPGCLANLREPDTQDSEIAVLRRREFTISGQRSIW